MLRARLGHLHLSMPEFQRLRHEDGYKCLGVNLGYKKHEMLSQKMKKRR